MLCVKPILAFETCLFFGIMNKFETELKAGNFVTSECSYCKKIVWPPSDYCNNCFNEVNWRKVSENGTIVELSRKENDVFCITEFENKIRVMGKLDVGIHMEIGRAHV